MSSIAAKLWHSCGRTVITLWRTVAEKLWCICAHLCHNLFNAHTWSQCAQRKWYALSYENIARFLARNRFPRLLFELYQARQIFVHRQASFLLFNRIRSHTRARIREQYKYFHQQTHLSFCTRQQSIDANAEKQVISQRKQWTNILFDRFQFRPIEAWSICWYCKTEIDWGWVARTLAYWSKT